MSVPGRATLGVLYPARLPKLTRLAAPPEFAEVVRWFWIPQWDVEPGRVSRQHVVGFPAGNVVVDSREDGSAGFAGPTTRASHQDLRGRGWAVGALLHPAAVPAFSPDPAADRDGYRRIEAPGLHRLVSAEVGAGRLEAAAGALGRWIAERVGPVGDEGRAANELVAVVEADPAIVRLEDAAARLGRSPRTLQRLARRYVGLPPAALIRRRRLQEAAERVRADPGADLARIAADLGYADHAHLTNEFRRVLGVAPSRYRRELPHPS
ncbi:helix-turn-helix domain-containing protein [Kineococcus rhizosphaerae]|uniref:AraC family transcriptional regulator n=1 Tax=Kineococcus rhizosphaerae TaxID=559628 RepID=A0A2T0R364_9ACTN|nr:helix-turn-helix domain-containing protein [Kineococcus rhizosphaerae]PRY14484.1 AraC family transcriptional regulator [Kineococcus rhizosphaerae]